MKIYGLGRISEIPPEPKLNYVPCALSLPLPSLPYVAFDLGDEHASKARLPRATHCHITLVASQFSPWCAERRKMFYGERELEGTDISGAQWTEAEHDSSPP